MGRVISQGLFNQCHLRECESARLRWRLRSFFLSVPAMLMLVIREDWVAPAPASTDHSCFFLL